MTFIQLPCGFLEEMAKNVAVWAIMLIVLTRKDNDAFMAYVLNYYLVLWTLVHHTYFDLAS